MAMIEFVRNYSDLSTDRGYQFEFRCDHCSNGYMSSYEASLIGTAGGLLQAAGSLFGGILGNAGNSTYQIQRAIGGPAHDRALQTAVAEVREKFSRCQRCGNWVCHEICWNERAGQCTGCTPKYEQEVISLRTQAQIQATREQLSDKAHGIDYVSGIDMNPDAQVRLNPGGSGPQLATQSAEAAPVQAVPGLPSSWTGVASHLQGQAAPAAGASGSWADVSVLPAAPVAPVVPAQTSGTFCTGCGGAMNGSKFCPACGRPSSVPQPKSCAACGHVSVPSAYFCEDCGGRLD